MINLFEEDVTNPHFKSSKGIQTKWKNNQTLYKADASGYEGLSEYVISQLLSFSPLKKEKFTNYHTVDIKYKNQIFFGCESLHFLPKGWQIITLERLFKSHYGDGLNKFIYTIEDYDERIKLIGRQTEKLTGLTAFGSYMSKLLAIDAFFLNEDRHTHNIAVLLDAVDEYHYCPIFYNGASLLSDIRQDYPLHIDLYE